VSRFAGVHLKGKVKRQTCVNEEECQLPGKDLSDLVSTANKYPSDGLIRGSQLQMTTNCRTTESSVS